LVTLAVSGCSWFHSGSSAKPAVATGKTIVTPDLSLAAKVVAVNPVGRFVLLNFPADKMPKLQQTLFVYRSGMKVAEVKVTGPQSENNTVADLVSGDPKVGDSVRAD
jgi:hypothetical protein